MNARPVLLRSVIAPFAVALLGVGCVAPPRPTADAGPWVAEVLAAEALADGNPAWTDRAGDAGYALELVVASVGLELESAERYLASLTRGTLGLRRKQVGHSWIRLVAPDRTRVAGHSGEYGKQREPYHDGVVARLRAGHPDPIGYLWEEMQDGILLEGSGGLTPTFACSVPITRGQHAAIEAFVETFDYRVFALRGRGCTDFVVAVARLADLAPANRLRVRVPRRIRYLGRAYTLWTDPAYEWLEYGSPEVLEGSLRTLVQEGAAARVGGGGRRAHVVR